MTAVAVAQAAADELEAADCADVEQVVQQPGAAPNALSRMVSVICSEPAVRIPISLSKKAQRSTVSWPRSKRIPAPFPAATRAPRNSMSSMRTRPPRTTQMAFPSALAPSATITARGASPG